MSSEVKSSYHNLSLTALYIGVPILVGASCYYLYFSNSGNNDKNNKDDNNKDSKKDDKSSSASKKLTPIEEAMHLKQIGNQNFTRKNYAIAIEYYTKAIELSQSIATDIKLDDLATFYQNRAACEEALGHYEKVLDDCNKAIELKKNYTKAYIRRAKAYEKLENFDKAMVDAFSAALLDKFQNQPIMLLTDEIVKASSKAKAIEAMKTHVPQWPSNQTIKSYFSAFSFDPIQEKTGLPITKAEQLKPIFEEAMKEENNDDAFQLLVRGSCLSLMGDMKNAQVAFDKLLAIDNEELCSNRLKANALIKKAAIVISEPPTNDSSIEKDFENIFKILEQAQKLDPENPDTYLHKAQALTLSDKYLEAITTLDQAIKLKQDLHSAIAQKFYIEFKLSGIDTSFSSKSQQDELLKKFETLIEKNPNSHDLLQMYAQILTEMNLFEKADQVLINLSKMDPNDGSIYVSRALLQFHVKTETDEVVTLLKKALEIDPKILFASEILGSIETQKGKIDDAITIFETALKYAQNESEYARCYSLVDSAKSQKIATELLGM